MNHFKDTEPRLYKFALKVAEESAVLAGGSRRDARAHSDCAKTILWSAEQVWDGRRAAHARDTIIEQLKHVLGTNPHIPLRFSLRNDFPEFPSRSQALWTESVTKVLAAPLLVTIIGASVGASLSAILRIFVK